MDSLEHFAWSLTTYKRFAPIAAASLVLLVTIYLLYAS